jgi:hypothetical protein
MMPKGVEHSDPAVQALGLLFSGWLDRLSHFTPLWRYVDRCLELSRVPSVPPRVLHLRFRQELSAMPTKVFYAVAVIPPTPRGQDIAAQDFRFRVDDGEEQAVDVPLSDTEMEFELPVGLRIDQRIQGTFGLIDDSPNQNRAVAAEFDQVVTADLDTTAPTVPEGFALRFNFRQAMLADDGTEVPVEAGGGPVEGGEVPPSEPTPPTEPAAPTEGGAVEGPTTIEGGPTPTPPEGVDATAPAEAPEIRRRM